MGVSLGGSPPAPNAAVPLGVPRRPAGWMPRIVPGSGPWAKLDGLCGRLAAGQTYHLASGGSREGGDPKGEPPEPALHLWGSGPRPAAALCRRRCARSFLHGELGSGGSRSPQGARGTAQCRPRRSRGAHPSELISPARPRGEPDGPVPHDSYLVDSASSHMLVSKIKPCMSKYKQLYRETANGSLYKLSFI